MNDKTSEILDVSIEEELQSSYLDYAMSVIVSRALPDVRDGLKPVHRRILYSMHENKCDYNKPFKKSARIVGDVMGKYHPHGDTAIYDSLVRMAQNFSLRVPLIDGQGNFGSMDGDSPAAMRYTESRMQKIAHQMLADIDKETVEFKPNYDGSDKEPSVLPTKIPNLLVNGSGGIAVGMATNIPTYNLGEVIDGCIAYINNNDITYEELFKLIPGPDFPTGGTILGTSGSYNSLITGRGKIIIRAKNHIENVKNNKQAIILTEIPYQVNKARMIEKIAELVRDKKIEGISDLRDESNKEGVRVYIELKKDVQSDVVLNQLYKFSSCQISFSSNMLALDSDGAPKLMSVLDIIKKFVIFREEVIVKRTKYLLTKNRDKAHIYIGLAIAVANIDEVIKMIRSSSDSAEAKEKLMATTWNAEDVIPLIALVADKGNKVENNKCYFTETQAKAILDMKLSRLTGLEKNKIDDELKTLSELIEDYLDILSNHDRVINIIKTELEEIKEEYATPRITAFEDSEFEEDIEDLITKEEMVVTVTTEGYIKRVALSTYRAQGRGGKGRNALKMNDNDMTQGLYVANTHSEMLFFSNTGHVYKQKVYKLPLGSPISKGRALINIFPLNKDEFITNIMVMPKEEDSLTNMIFATANGMIRRSDVSDFKLVQSNGKIAIRLENDDELIAVIPAQNSDHIILATKLGKSIRFEVSSLRTIKNRNSVGVRGVTLQEGDNVNSMDIIEGVETSQSEREEFLKIPLEIRSNIENISDQEINKEIENLGLSLSVDRIKYFALKEEYLFTITKNGYGKRTSLYEYRVTNRGGKGILNIITSERNGNVVTSFRAKDEDNIMLITDLGKIIRLSVSDVRVIGRNTKGVIVFRVAEGEEVVSSSLIKDANKEDEYNEEDNIATEENINTELDSNEDNKENNNQTNVDEENNNEE